MFLVPKVAPISHTDVGCRRDNREVRWCVKSVVVPDGDVLVVGCVLFSKRKVWDGGGSTCITRDEAPLKGGKHGNHVPDLLKD